MENKKAVWLWLLQRISAALLLVTLSLHIWSVHYAELGKPILFTGVTIHLKNLLYFLALSSLLFLGLFHGLNGLRTVLLDFGFLSKYERLISWTLVIIGMLFFIWGMQGLWAFLITKS